MCLIVLGLNVHSNFRLILSANRDEFYERPTEPAAFWSDEPEILAGRDLVYGGTWLGVTKTGRFAAVTNYRDATPQTGTRSRGDLTTAYLKGNETPVNYIQRIGERKDDYSGFNLIVGDFAEGRNELLFLSNRSQDAISLQPGIYGLSNALLDESWPKVNKAKNEFTKHLREEPFSFTSLISILADQTLADDENLPRTGIGIERERALSAAFVKTKGYGTRSSTILTIDRSGTTNFMEKTFVGLAGLVQYNFKIE